MTENQHLKTAAVKNRLPVFLRYINLTLSSYHGSSVHTLDSIVVEDKMASAHLS